MGHWGYMEPVLDFDKAHQIVSILSELHLIGSQQQRTNPWGKAHLYSEVSARLHEQIFCLGNS